MKYFATMFISLCLAGLICLFLERQGFLELNAPGNHGNGATAKGVVSQPTGSRDTGPETSRPEEPATAAPELPATTLSGSPAIPSWQEETACPALFDFLAANGRLPEFENQLRRFLSRDCRFAPETAEEYLRMILWKNFVTLQNDWQGDEGEIPAAYLREKELKQAGFAARGLGLLTSELEAAETRLHEMLSRSKQENSGRGGV